MQIELPWTFCVVEVVAACLLHESTISHRAWAIERWGAFFHKGAIIHKHSFSHFNNTLTPSTSKPWITAYFFSQS